MDSWAVGVRVVFDMMFLLFSPERRNTPGLEYIGAAKGWLETRSCAVCSPAEDFFLFLIGMLEEPGCRRDHNESEYSRSS